jgi:hypothetical protein
MGGERMVKDKHKTVMLRQTIYFEYAFHGIVPNITPEEFKLLKLSKEQEVVDGNDIILLLQDETGWIYRQQKARRKEARKWKRKKTPQH